VKLARVDLGQRSETVRRANLSAIVRTLHENGPQSRSDLVARTGLTRSAIRALVAELTCAGLATEDRAANRGRPGRPSPEVSLIPSAAVAVAFSIGVDSLSAAVVGLGGAVLGVVRSDRPRGHDAVGAIVDDLAALLDHHADPRIAAALRDPLIRLCARYLLHERTPSGRALDPVAHFHLSNGARVERLNWLGDTSPKGLQQSAGIMVNYLYRLSDIEANHEAYRGEGRVAASSPLRNLARVK